MNEVIRHVDGQACQAYGALTEGVHVAGYTAERALKQLEWLLDDNRWQRVDLAFKDVNAFLDSIKLDNLRIVADQRKRIADRIRELQPEVSNRALGRMLGVDHQTINNDARGENSPDGQKAARGSDTAQVSAGENSPVLSGAQVAALAERTQQRDERNAAKKEARERRRLTTIDTCTIPDLWAAAQAGRKWGCIYADPPWLYDNQGTRAATRNHYEGLTVDEIIAKIPIAQIAADDAHLHLWVTNGFLFEVPRMFAAWGFSFRSSFVWVKREIGIGNYWRNSHEILLTAIRGDAKQFNDHNLRSWFECSRGKHSEKPSQVREMLERASPGPRIELFARQKVENWDAWGDGIERTIFNLGEPT